MEAENAIKLKYDLMAPGLNELSRRLFLAAEAKCFGYGGVAAVARATGASRNTIVRGLRDISAPEKLNAQRIRKPGGGRKQTIALDPTLRSDLNALVEPLTRGDPMSPLRWTCLSTRKLAAQLTSLGHRTSSRMVAHMLHEMEYSLQANRKSKEGASHPDRNAQFEYINRKVTRQLAAGEAAISVDTKKKELIGDFKNAGRIWRPKGKPLPVRTHDFPLKGLGKAVPYGIYDLNRNDGWVSVGIDHDTAEFAVESIRRWWRKMGYLVYAKAKTLLITADCGGSNGRRVRLWKWELQKLANETGLAISVCHFPPGTSKWNKIEHRLFSFITQTWKGQPLLTHATVVDLIAATTTKKGLRVQCALDTNKYQAGLKVSKDDFQKLNLRLAKFHGEWNYTIRPNTTT